MTIKELISNLYDVTHRASEGVEFLQEGLICNSLKPLDRVEKITSELHSAEKVLTEALLAEAKTDTNAVVYVTVPTHIGRIGSLMERIALALNNRIKEDILFSDKAIAELNFLLEKTKDVLYNTADIILARNAIIGGYIKESEISIARSAKDFATLHEERLI